MSKFTFVAVENAGYEKEYIWPREFKSSCDAWKWVERKYGGEERETLHVEVARKLPNGDLTYEY